VVEGVDAALAAGLAVNLRAVLDRDNVESFGELAHFAIERGWTKHPGFKTQIGRNYELHHCQSERSRLYTRVSLYEDLHRLVERDPAILEFHKPAFSIAKFLFERGQLPDPLFDACPACKTEWAFDYTGRIHPCTANVGKSGEAVGTFWPEVKLDAALVEPWEERDVLGMKSCQGCSVQLACGGGCGAVAKNRDGTVDAPDCRPVKELLSLGCSVYGQDLREHLVVLDGLETIHAKKVVFATGSSPRPINVKGEREYKGKGISYCATCDAEYYEGKHVIVIGGGNSAIEEALFITKFAAKITVVHQFAALSANKLAQEQAFANPKIEFLFEHEPREFLAEHGKTVDALVVEDLKTGEWKKLALSDGGGVFVFAGMQPNLEGFDGLFELDQFGYIKTDEEMHTSVPGVYAAGDVISKRYRQMTTALNDGTIASMVLAKEIAAAPELGAPATSLPPDPRGRQQAAHA
jgi:radical SAM protein with 4Fe4S-binding SPASM domain